MIQGELFPDKFKVNSRSREIIPSVFLDRKKLMRAIVKLHAKKGFDLDITYGQGGIWKDLPAWWIPRIRGDISKSAAGNISLNSTELPFKDKSLRVIMFDPPWMVYKGSGIMQKKYGAFHSVDELYEYMKLTMKECARVLRPRGVLVVKCQDFISGRRNIFFHNEVLNIAKEHYVAKDLLIFIAGSRPIAANIRKQQHVRKFHCYYLILKRKQKGQ